MKDKKQRVWLLLQILWTLIFVVGALVLPGKYRTMAILCAVACVYTLVHGLIRARAEQKLDQVVASGGGEEKNSTETEKKP